MDPTLTVEQAFEAMRNFLAQFNERTRPERKGVHPAAFGLDLREPSEGGSTDDPAQ